MLEECKLRQKADKAISFLFDTSHNVLLDIAPRSPVALIDLGGASSLSWVAEVTPSTTTLRRLTLLAAACAAGALVDGPQGRHCI